VELSKLYLNKNPVTDADIRHMQSLKDNWPASQFVNHGELFRNYPDLGATNVALDATMKAGNGAFAADAGGGIGLGLATGPTMRSVFTHELQHAVQGKEGFARGGSPEAFALNIEKFVPQIKALKDSIDKVAENSQGRLGELYRKAYFGGGLNWKESGEFDQLKKALPEYKAMRDAEDVFRQGRSNYDLYKSLAGEAEARLTQSRIPLTAAERRARPPWQEFDVPPEQQIVRGLLGQ
jgi:hypothetical protein